jgi:site-specific DNA-methyltransferase (adenine-specific)
LLPDAFFNIATHKSARSKALSLKIISILNFGKAFSTILTKTKGILIKNTEENIHNMVQCENINGTHKRSQKSFLKNPKYIFNSNISKNEVDTISYLYCLPHITLLGKAKWGLGIVTGNNKKFIKNKLFDKHMPVYKGSCISTRVLPKETIFIPNDLTIYNQVAHKEMYQAKEKLIYRFISSNLVFFHDTKQRYTLNSANFVIPDEDFPITQIQLSEILNSEVMNWLFKNIFDTIKVLKVDIESLPIHVDYFKKYSVFTNDNFANYLGLESYDTDDTKVGEVKTFRIKLQKKL